MTPRAVILGCAGPELGPAERRFFAEAAPWGFILFARNVEDPGQLRRLTDALRDSVGREAPRERSASHICRVSSELEKPATRSR